MSVQWHVLLHVVQSYVVVNFWWGNSVEENRPKSVVGLTEAAPRDTGIADCDVHQVERRELGQREKGRVEAC